MTDRSYRGGLIPLPTAPVITLASRHAAGAGLPLLNSGAAVSGTNPYNANDLLAFPFVISETIKMNKVFWVNGTSVSGNASIGLYNADFVLLGETASTVMANASVPQVVTLTHWLYPGLYYLALAHSTATTNRLFRWSITTGGAAYWKMSGCWKQASVTLGSLPNPATPVACTTAAFPLFGLITRTVFDV